MIGKAKGGARWSAVGWSIAGVVALAAAAAAGCSSSSVRTGCVTDGECGAFMRCEEGRCVPDLPDCGEGAPCGGGCCAPGEICSGGECVGECGGVRCGGACCADGDVCLADGCCEEDKACGDACCGAGEACVAGACSACPATLCAGECCDTGEACVGDVCCDGDRVCEDACCGRGEECLGGECVAACEGLRCDGRCCAPGEVCQDGECEAPCEGALCGDAAVCCARGDVCVDGACCPAVDACGESCCGAGTWCAGAGACVACGEPLCGDVCCGGEEVCYAGACCLESRVCHGVCCGESEVCEGETCHLDCGDGARCAAADGTESCCAGLEVCFMGACVVADVACVFDGDCALEEYCDEIIGACLPVPDSECEYYPPIGEFTPEVQWHWQMPVTEPHRQVMMTPAVANLTDDDGDGVVGVGDVPDVVVIAFAGSQYRQDGVMYVLSGDDGRVHYRVEPHRFQPGGSVAIGDVDADGSPDIVACGSPNGLLVLENDGTLKWSIPSGCADVYSHPAIADLDGDGTAEIVTDYRVFADGAEVCRGWDTALRMPAVADLDGDGRAEVVGGNRAFAFDPTSATPCAEVWTAAGVGAGHTAIADMDLDGDSDVVVVANSLWILDGPTGAVIWGPYPIPGGGHGGAPTVADFDGDGRPEASTAGLDYYTVYDLDCVTGGDPTYCPSGRADGLLWSQPTTDHSSSQTGSSVFDFEGDGAAEVVYADEHFLYIYRGVDGAVLYSLPNSSGTLFEYPLVVDVDNDARSEIVVISNDYAWGPTRGVRVVADALDNWVRTRRIWNQHTYHVTNVGEDGAIPTAEVPSWTVDGLNSYRQNVQTFGVHNAPNAVPEGFFVDDRHCPERYRLGVHVMNRGSRSVPAGLLVGFYEGDAGGAHTLVASAAVSRPLLSGGGEYVAVEWDVPAEMQDPGRVFRFYVVVDDVALGAETAVHECHEDDNVSEVVVASCEIL
jgi:hypothetical protein